MNVEQNTTEIRNLVIAMSTVIAVTMISGDDLAARFLFSGKTAAFRAWIKRLGITPLPGRRDVYDPVQIRACLDKAQGLGASLRPETTPVNTNKPVSLVEMWNAKNAA